MVPETAADWIWWILTAVVLGLVINIFSNFLFNSADNRFGQWSENRRRQRREQNVKKKEEFEERIQQLIDEPSLVTVESGRAVEYRVMSDIAGSVSLVALSIILLVLLSATYFRELDVLLFQNEAQILIFLLLLLISAGGAGKAIISDGKADRSRDILDEYEKRIIQT